MRTLYEPCACCGGIKEEHIIATSHGFEKLVQQLADEVYKSRYDKHYSPELVQNTANELMDAIGEGYGDLGVDWDTPDKLMLDKLVENVFSFSGAKSYHQLQDFTFALKDENGDLREWGDYQDAIDRLGYKYNVEWLRTEWETAEASATSAARWVEYESEKDIFPYLEYQTIGDDRVRPAHALLDGTRRHIEDAFWSVYYPPNGWKCRCEALQVDDSDLGETSLPTQIPTLDPMFKTNLAKSGLIFPKGHPYYEGVPADVLKRALQYIPEKFAYRTRDGYEEHAMVQHEQEAETNGWIANKLARSGIEDIQLMPRLHQKEVVLRKKIYGKEYIKQFGDKCPDSFVNGMPMEFKQSFRGNMSKRVLEAARQANMVVIKSNDSLTQEYMERFISGQWAQKDRTNVTRIYIINDGEVYAFDRP